MKKFLINSLQFCGLLMVLMISINLFQSTYNYEPPHYKMQYEAVKQDSYNGIILGTSHATHGIRPSILDETGINFYNFSLNGANSDFYIDWLSDFFFRYDKKLDYCIIAVDNYFLAGNAWRKLENDSEYIPFNAYMSLAVNPKYSLKDLITNRYPLIKHRKRIVKSLQLNKGDSNYIIKEFDRGFIPYEIPVNESYYQRDNRNDVKITSEQKMAFLKLINLISTECRNIIFVMPPEYDIEKSEFQSLNLFMNEISANRKIPFFNFNDDLSNPDFSVMENFSDRVHMNSRGSELFSRELQTVIKNYITESTN